MNKIVKKYKYQLDRPRELESEETILKLKIDQSFRSSTAHNLISMAYCSGYDVLAEDERAKMLIFISKLEQDKEHKDVVFDKKAYTYFISKGYQSGDICFKSPEFIFKKQENGSMKIDQTYTNFNKKSNIEKRILEHTFSYEICQNRIDKRIKKSIDTAGDHVCDFTDEEKRNAYLLNKTIGFSLRPSSSAYILDIDSKSEQDSIKALNTFKEIAGVNGADSIIFVERSLSGGFHLVVRFGDYTTGVSKEDLFSYIRHMNENVLSDSNKYMKIDILSNGVRCLFSSSYVAVNYDYNYPDQLGEVYSSIFDAVKDYSDRYKASTRFFEFPRQQKEELQEAITETKRTPPVRVMSSNIYRRRIKKSYSNSPSTEGQRINKGHRWDVQRKVIPSCKAKGVSSEETFSYLLSITDSCDAMSNMEKWKKEVDSFYDKIDFSFSCTTATDGYCSQEQHIPSYIKRKISNESFIIQVIKDTGKKVSNRNISIYRRILTEMYGTFYYDIINPKQVFNSNKNNSLIGSQFSHATCILMKKEFPELASTDVYGTIRSILKHSSLFKKHSNHYFESTHSHNNKCSQWLLSSSNDIKYTIDTLSSSIIKGLNRVIQLIRKTYNSIEKVLFLYNTIIVKISKKNIDQIFNIDGRKYILDY